jgi:ribonucleotide monophosphatase NagD (HAD superfamily)
MPHADIRISMVNGVIKRYGVKRSEIAIIGDRGYTDIRMGHDSGLLTILVLSGETKSVKGLPWKPQIVASGIGELNKYL